MNKSANRISSEVKPVIPRNPVHAAAKKPPGILGKMKARKTIASSSRSPASNKHQPESISNIQNKIIEESSSSSMSEDEDKIESSAAKVG